MMKLYDKYDTDLCRRANPIHYATGATFLANRQDQMKEGEG
jgi:hypothetical protein